MAPECLVWFYVLTFCVVIFIGRGKALLCVECSSDNTTCHDVECSLDNTGCQVVWRKERGQLLTIVKGCLREINSCPSQVTFCGRSYTRHHPPKIVYDSTTFFWHCCCHHDYCNQDNDTNRRLFLSIDNPVPHEDGMAGIRNTLTDGWYGRDGNVGDMNSSSSSSSSSPSLPSDGCSCRASSVTMTVVLGVIISVIL